MLEKANPYPTDRRPQPENLEAEQALLGALLVNNEAFSSVPETFGAHHFSNAVNEEIFTAIKKGAAANKTISPVTIRSYTSPEFMQTKVGELSMSEYIARLCANAVNVINTPDYCEAITAAYRRREAMFAAEIMDVAASSSKDDEEFIERIKSSRDRLDSILDSSVNRKTLASLKAIRWNRLKYDAPQLEYIVEDMLTAGDRSIIVGAPGSAKSWLAIDLGMAIARGTDFLGRKVKQGGVLYQAKEGSSGFSIRAQGYNVHHGIDENEDVPFMLLPDKIDLFENDGDTDRLIREINGWKETSMPDMRILFIDTLNRAMGAASEISDSDMRKIISHVERIQTECGIHVCILHHPSAAGRLRGHTSLIGDFDQIITVTRDSSSDIRTMTLTKQKEGLDGVQTRFSLSQVKLWYDEEKRKDVTSCVILSVTEKQRLEKELEKEGYTPNKAERVFLLNFFEAQRMYGQYVIGQEGLPRAAMERHVVHFSSYLDAAISNDPSIGDDPDAVKKARNSLSKWFTNNPNLQQYGVIRYQKPYMWWTGKPVKGFPETFPKNNPDAAENYDAKPDAGIANDEDVGF